MRRPSRRTHLLSPCDVGVGYRPISLRKACFYDEIATVSI